MPVLEDPSAYGYYRQEGGGLMVGLFEAGVRAVEGRRRADRHAVLDLEPGLGRMGPYLETRWHACRSR
jgi:4-methylaminobutanoate oxidase (formaldehyde-forming)